MATSQLYAVEMQGVSATTSIWKIVLSLIFIVIFIPACLWLMKKFQLAQMKLGQSEIKVINIQSLGAKEKLMLIEVEGDRMLIGVTAYNISHLKNISSKKESFASIMSEMDRDLESKEGSL